MKLNQLGFLEYIYKNIIVFSCIFFICLSFMVTGNTVSAKEAEPYIRVGILQRQDSVAISANNDFVVKDVDNGKNYKFDRAKVVEIKQDERKVFINKKGKETTTIVVAVKNNDPVIVNGKRYRGSLIIQPHKAGLTVINRVLIDDYLKGVIPEEMPYDWDIEALKAQAVAARTYALYDKMDRKHTKEGFDVCATTDCQVYGGIDAESSPTNNAVEQTKGQVLMYKNEPICAVFHAAAGSYTENSEDAWGVTVPYLRAVNNKEEKSPYEQWSENITVMELSRIISQNFENIGTIKQIDTSNFKQEVGNKQKVIRFTGSNKKVVELTGAQLRSILQLNSSNFIINVTADNKKVKSGNIKRIDKPEKEVVNIIGSGLGHRLGLSQWGAKSLADKGENYRDILHHYYTNVELKTIY